MLISNLASDFNYSNWFPWKHRNNALKAASLSHHGILLILMQALIAWYQIDAKDLMSAGMPFTHGKTIQK